MPPTPTSTPTLPARGTNVFFWFGDLTNADRDVDQEFIVVEFNALVENIVGNQAYNNVTGLPSTPITLGNRYRTRIGAGAGTLGTFSAVLNAGVVEPLIFNPVKAVTTAPGDAGDTVVYTLTATNSSAAPNGAAAFEVRLTDTLNANLALQSVAVVAPGSTITDNSNIPGNQVDVSLDRLNPSGERGDYRDGARDQHSRDGVADPQFVHRHLHQPAGERDARRPGQHDRLDHAGRLGRRQWGAQRDQRRGQ